MENNTSPGLTPIKPSSPSVKFNFKDKKVLIIAAIFLLLIFVIFIFSLLSSPKPKDTNPTGNENTQRNSPTVPGQAFTNKPITYDFKKSNFYPDAYEIYPQVDPATKDHLAMLFDIQPVELGDGFVQIDFLTHDPYMSQPSVRIKPGEKVYLVDPFIRKQVPGAVDIGDISILVIDSKGQIVPEE